MSEPSPDADRPTIRFLNVDGVRLRTSVRGSGRPLLIITGLGASLDLGVPVERELASRGIQTISFDAPGIGQSTAYSYPRRMPGVARTIAAMLDALGYDQVDVVGISLGGVVAQQFTHRYPKRVRRLVLCATGPGVVGLGGVPGSPKALLALSTRRRYKSPEYYRRIAGDLYGGEARKDPDALLHGSLARFTKAPTLRGYLGQMYAISFWTAVPWLRSLKQPTLVINGDDDPIVPLINGRNLARCIPNARLHVVKGGGHLFLLERPIESAQLVADFLHASSPDATRKSGQRPVSVKPAGTFPRNTRGTDSRI